MVKISSNQEVNIYANGHLIGVLSGEAYEDNFWSQQSREAISKMVKEKIWD